jgi:hypothetical protein
MMVQAIVTVMMYGLVFYAWIIQKVLRQRDGKTTANADLAFYRDGAAVQFCQVVNQRKP